MLRWYTITKIYFARREKGKKYANSLTQHIRNLTKDQKPDLYTTKSHHIYDPNSDNFVFSLLRQNCSFYCV